MKNKSAFVNSRERIQRAQSKFLFSCSLRSFTAICFTVLFSTISSRAEIPPAEELLPSDTLLVFTIPDFAALRNAAGQSPQWLFWNDPAMKPFREKFIGKWNENFVAPLERDLGVKLADFEDLPHGQLTVAVTQNNWNGSDEHSPGFLLLLDAKTNSESLKTNLVALQKKWLNDGKPIRTETVRGVSFSIVTLAENDIPAAISKLFPKRPPVQELGVEPKPEKPPELVIGQFESLLIVGNSIEAVAPVVAHLTGSGMPSLNDNAAFAADKLSRFREAPLCFGWFNAKTFFNTLASIPPTPPNPDAPTVFPEPQWGKIFAAIGLTGVNSASFTYRQNSDGMLLDFFIAAPDSSRSGIFKIFAAEPKTAIPPPFVPVDATKFWRWRLDSQHGWDELQKMAAEIAPGALAGISATLDMANATGRQTDPGFDIRAYLIHNLGDDFIRVQKPTPGNPSDISSLFLIGTHNADGIVASVKTVLSLSPVSQQMPPPRDFLGHKIIAIPLPSQRVAGGPQPPPRLLYCAAGGDYVALAMDVSMIEEFLRSAGNPPKPLTSAPDLIEAAQRIGGAGKGLFGYQNQRETIRSLFSQLKNQPATSASRLLSLPQMPREMDDWMDFSLLPDFDRVSKYFYFSVFAGETTTDGMELKFFAPRPPELK